MKILLIFSLIILHSCQDSGIIPNYGCTDTNAENYDSGAQVDDGSCILEYTYTWSNDIVPILSNCIDCHELTVSFAVNNSLNPEDNDMFRRINLTPNTPDFMPQGYDPLTSQNIEKIRIWLLEGAPE